MRRVVPLFVLLLGAACRQEPIAPLVEASLTTDKNLYVATSNGVASLNRFTVTVVARYANAGNVPIYLQTCGNAVPIYSVQLVGDTAHQSAFDPRWACPGGVPSLMVAPGEVRVDTLELRGPTSTSSDGTPIGALGGHVQIVYATTSCAAGSQACLLPEAALGMSNVITIQMPE